MLHAISKILSRLFCCGHFSSDLDAEADCEVKLTTKPHHGPTPCVPPIFTQHYAKVADHDVTVKEAICITSDIAVLGNASVSGGDACITGNVLVAGDVHVKGSPCVTGDAIILGNANVEGQVCVTGDVFVHGDLAVKGKLDVGGKLCVFGSKDIQPAH